MSTSAELREQLAKRGLDASGRKAVLQDRLLAAMLEADKSEGSPAPAAKRRATTRVNTEEGKATSQMAGAADKEDAHRVEVLEQLECPVCTELILPPVHQCSAGHVLCADCKTKLPTPPKCPKCRDENGFGRNLALEQLAANISLPCLYAEGGCCDTVKYAQFKEHKENCDFRPVACCSLGCDFRGSHDQLIAHLTDHSTPCRSALVVDEMDLDDLGDPTNHRLVECWEKADAQDSLQFDSNAFWDHMHLLKLSNDSHDCDLAFYVKAKTGSVDKQGFVSFTVWFIGRESEREKYTWTLTLKNNKSTNRIKYTAQPLSIHHVCADMSFPHVPRFGRGVLQIWEDDLRLFVDDGDPVYTISFRKLL